MGSAASPSRVDKRLRSLVIEPRTVPLAEEQENLDRHDDIVDDANLHAKRLMCICSSSANSSKHKAISHRLSGEGCKISLRFDHIPESQVRYVTVYMKRDHFTRLINLQNGSSNQEKKNLNFFFLTCTQSRAFQLAPRQISPEVSLVWLS